jgi:hypothetical protein
MPFLPKPFPNTVYRALHIAVPITRSESFSGHPLEYSPDYPKISLPSQLSSALARCLPNRFQPYRFAPREIVSASGSCRGKRPESYLAGAAPADRAGWRPAVPLALALLVLRIAANHPHHAATVNHLALIANLFYRCPNLHF